MANPSVAINFPSDSEPKSKKRQKDWNLQWCRAIWSTQSSQFGAQWSGWSNRILNLRREGTGLADIDKFKSQLSNDGNTAFMKLQWDVSTPIPTIVENIVGQYMNQGYKVDATALNPESQTEYDKKKRELEANRFIALHSNEIEAASGIKPKINESELFQSTEEIELHLDLNWKESTCLAMESGMKYVHNANDEDSTKKLIIRDLIEIGVAGKRVYFDEDLSIRERAIDPLNLVTSISREEDFTDIKYAGEVIYMTVDDLAMVTDFTDEELMEIARSSANMNGNAGWDAEWEKQYYPMNYSSANYYSDFNVRILDGEYYSYDKIEYEKIKGKKGSSEYFQRVNGKPKKKENVVSKRIKTIYKAKWIINTKYIYDFGLKENMIRDRIKGFYSTDTPLSFVIYMPNIRDMRNKSLVEKMVPYSNMICIMQLKAQQLIAKSRPNGVAVDVAAIAGAIAGLGMDGFGAEDLQNLYEQTGNYYYSSMTEDGRQMNNPNPVRELPESLMSGLNQIVAMTNHYLQQLEIVTGVPMSTIGAPDKDALVGIEKMKTVNRNNSTRFIEIAYKNILGRSSKMITLMIQDALKLGKGVEDFAMAIGQHNTDILKLEDKIHLTEYGLFINVLPDSLALAKLDSQIEKALMAGSIKQSDAMRIGDIGKINTDLAVRYIELSEKKYSQEKLQQSTAASQAQAQAQAQSAALIEQEKQKTLQMEWTLKSQYLQLEYQLKGQESMQDHQENIVEIQTEGEEKIEQIEKATEMTMDRSKKDSSESISGSIPRAAGIRQTKIPRGGM